MRMRLTTAKPNVRLRPVYALLVAGCGLLAALALPLAPVVAELGAAAPVIEKIDPVMVAVTPPAVAAPPPEPPVCGVVEMPVTSRYRCMFCSAFTKLSTLA